MIGNTDMNKKIFQLIQKYPKMFKDAIDSNDYELLAENLIKLMEDRVDFYPEEIAKFIYDVLGVVSHNAVIECALNYDYAHYEDLSEDSKRYAQYVIAFAKHYGYDTSYYGWEDAEHQLFEDVAVSQIPNWLVKLGKFQKYEIVTIDSPVSHELISLYQASLMICEDQGDDTTLVLVWDV